MAGADTTAEALASPTFTGPVALNVKVQVKPERREEFLDVIRMDAEGTMTSEPGALQFTLGEDVDDANTFHLHEQYRRMEDVNFHQTTPHFAEWKSFCDTQPFTSDPIIQIYQLFAEAENVDDRLDRPYNKNSNNKSDGAYCLNVELCPKPELREEFLEVILNNMAGSREEPLCLQYDFGEIVDEGGRVGGGGTFYFHEQYTGSTDTKEGFLAHQASPHFAAWETFANKDGGPFVKPPVVSFYRSMKNILAMSK